MLESVDSISDISRQAQAHDSIIKFCPSEHRSRRILEPRPLGDQQSSTKFTSLHKNYCAGHADPSKKGHTHHNAWSDLELHCLLLILQFYLDTSIGSQMDLPDFRSVVVSFGVQIFRVNMENILDQKNAIISLFLN